MHCLFLFDHLYVIYNRFDIQYHFGWSVPNMWYVWYLMHYSKTPVYLIGLFSSSMCRNHDSPVDGKQIIEWFVVIVNDEIISFLVLASFGVVEF